MTGLDAIARQMNADPPSANGKDPLAESGLTALAVGCDLADVAMALRRWRPLLPSDPLARRVERGRAIEQRDREFADQREHLWPEYLEVANLVAVAHATRDEGTTTITGLEQSLHVFRGVPAAVHNLGLVQQQGRRVFL